MKPIPNLLLGLCLTQGVPAMAQIAPPTVASPTGIVRIAGNVEMRNLIERWAKDFEQGHPGIRVETDLRGSDVAMAQLYTAKVDIAIIGRDATEPEAKAFEWIFRYPPARQAVAYGSLNQPGRSPALAIVVHRDNPLSKLSMPQLAAIFGAATSDGKSPRTWGDLGLTGRWKNRPIKLYGPEAESGTGRFFRATVLGGSNKMRWESLTEFADPVDLAHAPDKSGQRAAAAVAKDPNGIGISYVGATKGVKTIALSKGQDDEAIALTKHTVASSSYPLSRTVYAYFNRPAQAQVDAETQAFLDHISGKTGQQALAEVSNYIPFASR